MKILITGASSYVGARIYFDLRDKYQVVGTYYQNKLYGKFIQLDLTKFQEVNQVINKLKPDIIVHVANYPSNKYVTGNKKRFVALNKNATQILVEVANTINSKIVFISSLPAIGQNDNLYLKLKLVSEKIVKRTKAGYLIIRPCLTVGLSPNCVNDRTFNKILKLIHGDSKTLEFDTCWKFRPTYIGHISQVIHQAIKKKVWNSTVPVIIDKVVDKYTIASDILKHYKVATKPTCSESSIPLPTIDFRTLSRFFLRPKSYEQMIDAVLDEIKNKDSFDLN